MAERPEDLNLPNSVIAKIIKDALPEGIIVSKDARTAVSKAASVFVLYSTSCANNFALQSKRKTITAQDVLDAMKEMEFEQFIEPLQKNLEAYRLSVKGKKEASEKRKKEKEDSTDQPDTEAGAAILEEDEYDAADEDVELQEPQTEVIEDDS